MERFVKETPQRRESDSAGERHSAPSGGVPNKHVHQAKKSRFIQRGARVSQASSSMKTGHS